MIVKSVGEELELLAASGSKNEWFEKLTKKCLKSLPAQLSVFPETKNQVQQQVEPSKVVKPPEPARV